MEHRHVVNRVVVQWRPVGPQVDPLGVVGRGHPEDEARVRRHVLRRDLDVDLEHPVRELDPGRVRGADERGPTVDLDQPCAVELPVLGIERERFEIGREDGGGRGKRDHQRGERGCGAHGSSLEVPPQVSLNACIFTYETIAVGVAVP